MKEIVHVSSNAEIIYWEQVFRVLGVRRCLTVLQRVGVPGAVATRPEGATRAAASFWEQRWAGIKYKGIPVAGGLSDPNFAENYRQGIHELLERCFGQISEFYDEVTAVGLYAWAHRFFIDHEQVGLWDTWSILFSSVHHPEGGLDPGTFGFSDDALKIIRATLQRHFGSPAVREDAEALDRLKGIPLSPFERRIVALEATQPGDLPEVDLNELLSMLVRYEHAYRAWVEIGDLPAGDREALLWWGYRQAELLGLPAEDVKLPDSG